VPRVYCCHVNRFILSRTAAPLVLLAVMACGRAQPEAAPESVWQPAPADSGIAVFFAAGPVHVGSSRADLAAMLGEPDSTQAIAFPNRHDPTVTDSLFTLHYDGLVATVHRAGYDGKEILTSLGITSDRFLQPDSPIRLGSPLDAVHAVLGEPDEADAATLTYMCDDCLAAGYDIVHFHVQRDTVRSIEVHYWVD
jgi:hypothetical protein